MVKRSIPWIAATLLCVVLIGLTPAVLRAEEAPAPTPDKVIEDLGKIGPDALAAHVAALKKTVDDTTKQAQDMRAQADALEAQAKALQAKIEAIEKFVAAVNAAIQPAPAPAEAAPAAQ